MLSPAYMLPDDAFGVLDKCPQLATRTCVGVRSLCWRGAASCRVPATAWHAYTWQLACRSDRVQAVLDRTADARHTCLFG